MILKLDIFKFYGLTNYLVLGNGWCLAACSGLQFVCLGERYRRYMYIWPAIFSMTLRYILISSKGVHTREGEATSTLLESGIPTMTTKL